MPPHTTRRGCKPVASSSGSGIWKSGNVEIWKSAQIPHPPIAKFPDFQISRFPDSPEVVRIDGGRGAAEREHAFGLHRRDPFLDLQRTFDEQVRLADHD